MYSAMNAFCISIGLSGFLLMILYVDYELSYDEFHEYKDRIYRLENHYIEAGTEHKIALTPPPWGPALLTDYPGVESMVRLRFAKLRHAVHYNHYRFYAERVAFADSTVFGIFTFPLVRGNPKTALVNPHTVVISESVANTLFGKDDPIGSTLTITGVMENVPKNSHIQLD